MHHGWGIEVTYRDLKQHLGFGDSQARTRLAVERTAPLIGLLYTLVVLWYAEAGIHSPFDVLPLRPWYRQKKAPSFEDMLEAARRAARQTGFVDELGGTGLAEKPGGRGTSDRDDEAEEGRPRTFWKPPPWAKAA